MQFFDAEGVVQLHVRNENTVDEGDQCEHEGTHPTLSIGHGRERANTLNRHEHEDQHGDLRIGGIVSEHRKALAVDHFSVVDNIDEFRQIDIESTRWRRIEDEHFRHMRDEEKETIVEEQSNEIDTDRTRAETTTKKDDDTNNIAEETTDKDRRKNIAQDARIDTFFT